MHTDFDAQDSFQTHKSHLSQKNAFFFVERDESQFRSYRLLKTGTALYKTARNAPKKAGMPEAGKLCPTRRLLSHLIRSGNTLLYIVPLIFRCFK